MTIRLDYYYGMEAEQFSFYRIPKILFKDERYKSLSCDAKLLYGLMLDRMSLSIKNGWLDEHGRVYIYYTTEHIMEDLGCGREKCSKVVAELDSKKGIGLIEKKRQGLGKPDVIYVKNFMGVKEQYPEVRKSNVKKSENRTSGSSGIENVEVGKSNANNTELNNTNNNKSNHIVSNLVMNEEDVTRKIEDYKNLIKENIRYDDLMVTYFEEKEIIDEIVELMQEIVICQNEFIILSGYKYPAQFVKNKFWKIGYRHVVYVLECMQKNTSAIKNIKKYLLVALFNAPSTIESYYNAKVNYDMPQFA